MEGMKLKGPAKIIVDPSRKYLIADLGREGIPDLYIAVSRGALRTVEQAIAEDYPEELIANMVGVLLDSDLTAITRYLLDIDSVRILKPREVVQ